MGCSGAVASGTQLCPGGIRGGDGSEAISYAGVEKLYQPEELASDIQVEMNKLFQLCGEEWRDLIDDIDGYGEEKRSALALYIDNTIDEEKQVSDPSIAGSVSQEEFDALAQRYRNGLLEVKDKLPSVLSTYAVQHIAQKMLKLGDDYIQGVLGIYCKEEVCFATSAPLAPSASTFRTFRSPKPMVVFGSFSV